MCAAERKESGQAMVEFAVIALILLALTVGFVDVGRAFYQYNAIASAATMAARWASVQGGNCNNTQTPYESTADWCNDLTTSGTKFWAIKGNYPLQGNSNCPTSFGTVGTDSYQLSDSTANGPTTIVGTVFRRLDTTPNSSNVNVGNWLAGLEPSKTSVCIQLSSTAWQGSGNNWSPQQGDIVTVFVYYHFTALSGLFGKNLVINMAASSRYVVE
jgi:Flp pilus assembly protein TadG